MAKGLSVQLGFTVFRICGTVQVQSHNELVKWHLRVSADIRGVTLETAGAFERCVVEVNYVGDAGVLVNVAI